MSLASTMRAAVWNGVGQPIRTEQLEMLPVAARDVRVRVGAAGVCISDAVALVGEIPVRLPHILGHSAVGIVEEIGAQVRRVSVGDRVLVSVTAQCQACSWCLEGRADQCSEVPFLGTEKARRADGTPVVANTGIGAFAEAVTAPEAQVVRVDADIADAQLTLLGCSGTAGLGAALLTAPVVVGSTVAVLGCGPVGLSYIQGARLAGAKRIIAIEPVAARRDLALKLGATDAFDPFAEEVLNAHDGGDRLLLPTSSYAVAKVRELTGGYGADYVFEASADANAMGLALSMSRRAGHVTFASLPRGGLDAHIQLNAVELALNGRHVHSCQLGSAHLLRDIPRFAKLIECGDFNASAMISHRFTLDQAEQALRAALNHDVVAGVLLPNSAGREVPAGLAAH